MLLAGGCGPPFEAGTTSSGAGAAGAAGGEAGGAGGGLPVPKPTVFECHCNLFTPEGKPQSFSLFACAYPGGGDEVCAAKCADYDNDGEPNGDAELEYAQSIGEACPPELEREVISGEEPNSIDVPIDRESSELVVRFAGDQTSAPVGGGVSLKGGCETGECSIEVLHAHFDIEQASFGAGGAVRLDRVRVLSVGRVVAEQSDGYFRIPHTQVDLILNAQVNGVHRASRFAPAQDLFGFYQPSTGELEIFGELSAGADGLSIDIRGRAAARPPRADAGPPRVVVANAGGQATVTLDGERTFDPDGDLVETFWYEGSKLLGTGARPKVTFGLGKHIITARAFDATNRWDDAETVVDVRKH
jgi:hypothetical protein